MKPPHVLRRVLTSLLALACLLTLLAACGGPTMSPARRARVDACLKQCSAAQTRGPDTPASGDWNRTRGAYDTRTACERSCY